LLPVAPDEPRGSLGRHHFIVLARILVGTAPAAQRHGQSPALDHPTGQRSPNRISPLRRRY
jgi:hypothetical protein